MVLEIFLETQTCIGDLMCDIEIFFIERITTLREIKEGVQLPY